MAFSQQAWEQFELIKNQLNHWCNAIATNELKDGLGTLEAEVTALMADPVLTAEVAALADTHYHCTSAHMLATYQKLMDLKAYLVANGF